jgi:hypothetical protein
VNSSLALRSIGGIFVPSVGDSSDATPILTGDPDMTSEMLRKMLVAGAAVAALSVAACGQPAAENTDTVTAETTTTTTEVAPVTNDAAATTAADAAADASATTATNDAATTDTTVTTNTTAQ